VLSATFYRGVLKRNSEQITTDLVERRHLLSLGKKPAFKTGGKRPDPGQRDAVYFVVSSALVFVPVTYSYLLYSLRFSGIGDGGS